MEFGTLKFYFQLHPLEEALEKELEKKRREKFKKLPIAKLVAGDEMLGKFNTFFRDKNIQFLKIMKKIR